jgi:hypothetical protein
MVIAVKTFAHAAFCAADDAVGYILRTWVGAIPETIRINRA